MSAVEAVIEKVRKMDDQQVRALLAMLERQITSPSTARQPLGARAMVGYARRFRPEPRATASWMEQLRAGEK